ncbi:hypothetical protein [Dickeya sp. NCPPB 3274]|uniref:hypothetical protein n=1 Tax=Dickeya sp. NCPPB 3274 TaxID=568766 RepID=UPI0012681BCB|nr:hypothetical protein [Dickeya sp. NCPPB 3274]
MSKIVLAQSRNRGWVVSALQDEKKRNQGMELVNKDDAVSCSWRVDKTAGAPAGIIAHPSPAASKNEINISIVASVAAQQEPQHRIFFTKIAVFLKITVSLKTTLILIMITITICVVVGFSDPVSPHKKQTNDIACGLTKRFIGIAYGPGIKALE